MRSLGSLISILTSLSSRTTALVWGLTAISMVVECSLSAGQSDEKAKTTDDSLITLTDKAIAESSGLAISRRRNDRYWTHNDSGDGPRLFAFDAQGRKTGQCQIPQATSVDWEDMASYVDQGTARLVVADCGDNEMKRKSIFVYFFDEPDPDSVTQINHFTKLELQYSDGPQNCEAMAVDVERCELVLLSKTILPLAGVYQTPLPQREAKSFVHIHATVTRSKTLAVPMITAMDVDNSNGDIWVGTYFDLFCFSCSNRTQRLNEQFSVMPKHFAMPRLKQIEALAVDSEHQIHVTSEGSPARMTRVFTETQR